VPATVWVPGVSVVESVLVIDAPQRDWAVRLP